MDVGDEGALLLVISFDNPASPDGGRACIITDEGEAIYIDGEELTRMDREN